MSVDVTPGFLDELEQIARTAGDVLMQYYGRLTADDVDFKGRRDLLTTADREAEEAILHCIHRLHPSDSVLAEESGKEKGVDEAMKEGTVWIVDPLDGTTNFVQQIPVFGVSIGVFRDGAPVAGCVFAPVLDELFLAGEGHGARLNDRPISVSATSELMDSVLATGFAYKVGELEADNLDNFCHLIPRTRAIRRCGSAALDLVHTACGRYDGFWELDLSPWDVAAGAAIVREAGGVVTDFAGGEDWLSGGSIVAGNPSVQPLLLKELNR